MTQSSFLKKSILAGILIGFGGIFSIFTSKWGGLVQGLCFSVGLFSVLLCEAKLFTGSILSIQDVWNKKKLASFVISDWIYIWLLNFIGATILATLICCLEIPNVDLTNKINESWYNLILKGIACNFLICLAVWIFKHSNKTVIDAALSSLLPVACFVTCGFEHCVADMFYMTLGYGFGVVDIIQCLYVIIFATIGNIIGGIFFSWLMYDKESKHE